MLKHHDQFWACESILLSTAIFHFMITFFYKSMIYISLATECANTAELGRLEVINQHNNPNLLILCKQKKIWKWFYANIFPLDGQILSITQDQHLSSAFLKG